MTITSEQLDIEYNNALSKWQRMKKNPEQPISKTADQRYCELLKQVNLNTPRKKWLSLLIVSANQSTPEKAASLEQAKRELINFVNSNTEHALTLVVTRNDNSKVKPAQS